MGALIHCPVGQRAREAFACPLGSGEMLGMDDVQDASLAVAKQDTDAFMSNEGAFERLNAFRLPPVAPTLCRALRMSVTLPCNSCMSSSWKCVSSMRPKNTATSTSRLTVRTAKSVASRAVSE
ncbi:hypothetical protein MASR2M16_08620 [Thauera terpenica]